MTIAHYDPWLLIGLGVAIFFGSFVQGSIGFGVALVAAPFIVYFAPELMPGALLLVGCALPTLQLLTERPRIRFDLFWPALLGRALFTGVGAWVVVVASTDTISLAVAGMVLLGVATAIWTPALSASRRNTFLAGAITGITGTAASIGGPFLALVLSKEPPVQVRSTLALFFALGAALSLAVLGFHGEFTVVQAQVGAVWLPFLGLGFWAAHPLRKYLPAARMRIAVLTFCTLSAPLIVLKVLLS